MTDKKIEDGMTNIDPSMIKIEFAPGCFDTFDGTQEELDGLIAEITRMVRSGEIHEKSRPIDFDDPTDEDIEAIEYMLQSTQNEERKLQ
jgi:hypothetical protein